MEETYTYDALVHFLYRELPALDAIETAQTLDADADLRAHFDELLFAKTQLPKVGFNPSSSVVNKILQYSAQTAFETYP